MKTTEIYDIDISFDGNNTFGVKWEESSDWERIPMAEYCEYLYSAGRIDGWDDERDGCIILESPDEGWNPHSGQFDQPGRRITYSFSGYLKEAGIAEIERDLLAWKNCAI